jgi:hypothetical protein
MNDTDRSRLDRLREFDARRAGFPGEHWLAFGLGLVLLLRQRRSTAGRLLSIGAGALLVARSLSGRDGPLAALERRAPSNDDTGFAEVAAPWPYDQRVRVSKPRRVRRSDRSIADAIGAGRSVTPSS